MKVTVQLEGIASKYISESKGSVIIDMYEGAKIKDIPDYLGLQKDKRLMFLKNGVVTGMDSYLESGDIVILRPIF